MVVLCVEFFAKVQNQMFLMQSTYKLCFRDDCIKKMTIRFLYQLLRMADRSVTYFLFGPLSGLS